MKDIRKLIIKELGDNENNYTNIGYVFLVDAIEIICNSEEPYKVMSNLENNVYSKLEIKYQKNMKTIKSDIVKYVNKFEYFHNDLNKGDYKNTSKILIIKIFENVMNCIK